MADPTCPPSTQAAAVSAAVANVLTEIEAGEGLSLSAAARLFPGYRGNRSADPSTVYRWLTKGVPGPGGHAVRLEGVRAGGRWLTSRPAITRFVAAITPGATPADPAPVPRSPAARTRAAAKAAKELYALGVRAD